MVRRGVWMNLEDPAEGLHQLRAAFDLPAEPDEQDPLGRVPRLVEIRRSGRYGRVAARVHANHLVRGNSITFDEDRGEVLRPGEHDCGVPVDARLQLDPRPRQQVAPIEPGIVEAREDSVRRVDHVRKSDDTGVEQGFGLKRERVAVTREALRGAPPHGVEAGARPSRIVLDRSPPASRQRAELAVGDEAIPRSKRERALLGPE